MQLQSALDRDGNPLEGVSLIRRINIRRIRKWIGRSCLLLLCAFGLSRSSVALQESRLGVRRFTQTREFDFISWTLEALSLKIGQTSLGVSSYLSEDLQIEFVEHFFEHVQEVNRLEGMLAEIYADPNISEPDATSSDLRSEVIEIRELLEREQPVAEAIIQEQVAVVIQNLGFGLHGTILPPVSFHFSQLPKALIVSPRDQIRQDANIQIEAEISVKEQEELEVAVEELLDVSALVVSIGGIGTYPTMIMETSDVRWLIETVVHEWVHNYLFFQPLGWNYNTSGDLRTMNETVASILGREIGRKVLEAYYPRFLPASPAQVVPESTSQDPPAFDFRAEMRITRVEVEILLLAGEIEQAEAYMESRQQIFWENGYRHIRKINQAYFAFHGAYADEPGGAAGDDPVGEAVRELWGLLQDPVLFLRTIAKMDSFDDLQTELDELTTQ